MDVPRHRSDDIRSKLADQVGARFTSSTIFGTAVERDGITVIPVASLRFGFGGGGGADASGAGEGEGGGAIGNGTAAGYIEIVDGRSRFVPIVHPARMAALACAAVHGVMVVLRRGHAPSR